MNIIIAKTTDRINRTKIILMCAFAAMALLIFCMLVVSPTVIAASGPSTSWHYAPNSNFSVNTFSPGADGFNLADVESTGELAYLPSGMEALVWVGLCNGVDSTFTNTVQPYVGQSKVWGYYLMDDPDPTGQYNPQCLASNLKAESDWIHTNDPGKKTFIILMNMSSSSNPSYNNTYKPSNSDVDYYGLDQYPCRSDLNGCDYNLINVAVAAAEQWGVPAADIIPCYQAFGGGAWTDDGGGSYLMPSSTEEDQILSTWAALTPTPAFDYTYSWGSQRSDTALDGSSSLQQVFATQNSSNGQSGGGSNNGGSNTSSSSSGSGSTTKSAFVGPSGSGASSAANPPNKSSSSSSQSITGPTPPPVVKNSKSATTFKANPNVKTSSVSSSKRHWLIGLATIFGIFLLGDVGWVVFRIKPELGAHLPLIRHWLRH